MTRLAEKNRVRSVVMGGTENVATGVDFSGVMTGGSHVFQDDVTIIGAQVAGEFLILDASMNADGMFNGIFELSRQAVRSQPGSILWVVQHAVWTAAIHSGGETRKSKEIMFPLGQGIEIDEGESINLLAFLQWVGTGTIATYGNAVVWYTER